ncbi:helix-turn-helix domain-containing protein [Gemmata sp.]|uniref:helix-turn-helix domain-containing protein n=1 Tax=Gemmata sp. TaxID=1914242 RepID=UPI003F6F535F
MPKATKPPKPTTNGPAAPPEVLTLPEAAAFLRYSEPVVQRLALSGRLPGRVAEGEWRFLRSALKLWLSGSDFERPPEPVSHLSSKERMLAVAGCLADDDSLDAMVEEIYRERKRHPVGGGT